MHDWHRFQVSSEILTASSHPPEVGRKYYSKVICKLKKMLIALFLIKTTHHIMCKIDKKYMDIEIIKYQQTNHKENC